MTATTTPTTTPRERRREATTAEIVDAAWELSREHGLASLSLRELAARVGMRAPSIYSYFDSKHAIFDAMFKQGQEQVREHMTPYRSMRPVTRAVLKDGTRHWIRFCTDDPVRYQLMFQRPIPGFEPSAESYQLAVEVLGEAGQMLLDAGITSPEALDLWTAVTTGLTDQQISNDPGGDRWVRLIDDAIDMLLDHLGALPTDTTADTNTDTTTDTNTDTTEPT